MSLKKKVILIFMVSTSLIAMLSAFLYLNFLEINREIAFLELTDTVRSKTLQLRRHEKNYFLYAPEKASDESAAIYQYLAELNELLTSSKSTKLARMNSLKDLLSEYRIQFDKVERSLATVSNESDRLKTSRPAYSAISRLVESNFLDKPLEDVRYLQEVFLLNPDHRLISSLMELDSGITAVRKGGENILTASKELDRKAREKVDGYISITRITVLVFFPLFLIAGFGAILFIISNVVNRLQLLTDIVEKTGTGTYIHMTGPSSAWGQDEVGHLIRKFDDMEQQLSQREKELLQSKKLAAIGSLAAGVAHELNNPLNNIHISAQVLQRELGRDCPPYVTETITDIVSQSMRVKRIVGDLLEYARGKELKLSSVELTGLIRNIYELLKISLNMQEINFALHSNPPEIFIRADREQLERVFINLFSNAVEAMSGKGDIIVTIEADQERVKLWVSDTGKGIEPEDMEKIFEPFFTTKVKGTGLGLAIVFNIIKKHRGEIYVDSEKDRGTTFYMVLPEGNHGV